QYRTVAHWFKAYKPEASHHLTRGVLAEHAPVSGERRNRAGELHDGDPWAPGDSAHGRVDLVGADVESQPSPVPRRRRPEPDQDPMSRSDERVGREDVAAVDRVGGEPDDVKRG